MAVHLSGIQPSGLLHLGNYFGAIRQHVALSEQEGEHFYFIADYHALTSSRDPEALRNYIRETAITYLALGLDGDSACLFRQSDVPEVTEIAWLLGTVAGMGLLERATSYKDKIAKGLKPSVGLFTYPVLMASDILAYGSDLVPVGKDQAQHVEMAQDMAASFNAAFDAEVFRRPEMLLSEEKSSRKVPGLDGQKMSKSYDNTIWLFETGKPLRKALNRIVTDSRPPTEPKNPDELLLFDLLNLFLDDGELQQLKTSVREGGEGAPGYGDLKNRLAEGIEDWFAPAREKRKLLLADTGEVDRILARGGEVARERAASVRDRALEASGLR